MTDFTVIRDPLWNNIQIDREALNVLDTEPFQRLRYIRQLGHAFLVYPGATHTRFEHAVGTYHLTRRVLSILADRGELGGVASGDIAAVTFAALLHDIGHYPFSHALEEAGLPSHERLARTQFERGHLREAMAATGLDRWEDRLSALIAGTSHNPLAGLISGSLDLDKIEYLTRDARMCGVPYGAVDVDRLLHALTVLPVDAGGPTIGIREKGTSALESLLFARYQMYRNVYWHHAVRSATAMFKRMVREALTAGHLTADWIANSTDDALMERLRQLPAPNLANRLYHRQLYKRAVEIPGAHLPAGAGDWVATSPDLVELVENRLAAEVGLPAGAVLLDFPAKPRMLAVELPMVTRGGTVVPLAESEDRIGLQRVAEELHTTARFARVYSAEPITLSARQIVAVLSRPADELQQDAARDVAWLSA